MEKPFIHLLKTMNGYYFFDVNKNEIVRVEKDVYDLLDAVLKNKIAEYKSQTKLKDLLEKGYLLDKTVKKIRHPYSDNLEYLLDRKIESVTLQVTQNCNLRCSYCVYSDLNNTKQRSHSNKVMSFATAKKAVDFLLDHSVDSHDVHIGFYGGEPLLQFDLMKQVVDYAEEVFLGREILYTVTTNGTLLTKKIVDFLEKHNFAVLISIDGPEEIHDMNRRFAADGAGSFQKVLSNLQWIKEERPRYFMRFSLSMVVDPQNSMEKINSLFFDYDIFKQIAVQASVVDDTYSSDKNVFSQEYIEQSNYELFCSALKEHKLVDGIRSYPISEQQLKRIASDNRHMRKFKDLPDESAPGGPCVPGEKRLFVDVNGDFFPCERVSESSEVMKIGNLDDGFDYDKCMALLNVGALTAEKCKYCWAFKNCNCCAKQCDNGDELSGELKMLQCRNVKRSFENNLYHAILNDEIKSCYS